MHILAMLCTPVEEGSLHALSGCMSCDRCPSHYLWCIDVTKQLYPLDREDPCVHPIDVADADSCWRLGETASRLSASSWSETSGRPCNPRTSIKKHESP